MPAWTYVIDKRNEAVLAEWNGEFNLADAVEFQKSLQEDPAFDSHYCGLIDLRGVTRVVDLNYNDMRHLAQITPFDEGARRAFIVARPEVFGLMRMFSMLRHDEPNQAEFFYEESKARQWLGLDGSG